MGFASPVWLLGLLPWAVVTLYLLPGRGTPAVVPFLGLWRGSVAISKRTARRWPGVGVFFALIALLLVILAAAEPAWRGRGMGDGEISIVLDRGATMALPSVSSKAFRNVIQRVGVTGERAKVHLIPVPGEPIATTGAAWAKTAEAMQPTAVRVQLDQVVADQMQKTRGPVLVLSDQHLGLTDKRIVQIFPETVAGTVAITSIGARPLPHPQVMVRLENHSDLRSVSVAVRSGKVTVQRDVLFPTSGQATDQFFDLPRLDETIEARVELDHQRSPWLTAYLARQSRGVRVALDPAVDDAVRRLAEIYGKDRPADANAQQILISTHPAEQAGICIVESSDGKTESSVVLPHEVTRNVRSWPAVGAAKMPEGFAPIVSSASDVTVAVRDGSARQVWINADLREWEKTPDFVVFFANALEWVGGNEQQYTSVLPSLGRESPGLYTLADGKQTAVNAGEFPTPSSVTNHTSASDQFESGGQGISLSAPTIFAALVCLLIAAIFWRAAS
jgi:hypothetical protein